MPPCNESPLFCIFGACNATTGECECSGGAAHDRLITRHENCGIPNADVVIPALCYSSAGLLFGIGLIVASARSKRFTN